MADELLFDSERQEKKARRRRWLFPVIALAAILVIAVIVALIIRGSRPKSYPGGEDTLYPYSWQIESDGSILLKLPHENDPEFRWTLTNPDELYTVEAAREETEKNGTTCFTLTPKKAGRDLVVVTLLREPDAKTTEASASEVEAEETAASEEEAPEKEAAPNKVLDGIYRITLLVEFSEEDGRLTGSVLSSSGVRCQGILRGGEDSENPYLIYSSDDRFVVADVLIASLETDWNCTILSGEESIFAETIQYVDSEVYLVLRAGETPGESEVLFRSEAAGVELRLRTLYQENSPLLVTEHQAQYGEKTVVSPTEDSKTVRDDDSQKNNYAQPKDPEETGASEAETEKP